MKMTHVLVNLPRQKITNMLKSSRSHPFKLTFDSARSSQRSWHL